MSNHRTALWAQLAQANLVQGEMPATESNATPWFVRAMLGVAGWIGALFLLGFLGAAFAGLYKSASAMLLIGVIACGAAAAMFRADAKNDFMGQFSFAISLAGQALILFGIAIASKHHVAVTSLLMAMVQAALFFLIPSFLHRVWCAWTAALAVAFALASWHLPFYTPALLAAALAWVWLSDGPVRANVGAQWRAGGYGIALALVQTVLSMHSGAMHWLFFQNMPDMYWHVWTGAALTSVVWLGIVAGLLRRQGTITDRKETGLAFVGAFIVALTTLKAPGFAPLLAVILLGFAHGARALAGLGALALLGYGVHYYYALEVSLLEKSILLVAAGVGLLLARLLMNRFQSAEASAHA